MSLLLLLRRGKNPQPSVRVALEERRQTSTVDDVRSSSERRRRIRVETRRRPARRKRRLIRYSSHPFGYSIVAQLFCAVFHTRILISLLGEKRWILSCTYSICNERIFLLAVVVKSVAVADVDDAVKFAGARKGRILLDTRVTQEREVKEIVRHNFPLFGGRVLLGFGPPSLGFLVHVLLGDG